MKDKIKPCKYCKGTKLESLEVGGKMLLICTNKKCMYCAEVEEWL